MTDMVLVSQDIIIDDKAQFVMNLINGDSSRYKCKYQAYGKCPKLSNTKVSDKMTYANSADPDQTAPEGAV